MSDGYIAKQKRGFFGWVFLLVFLGWNALMLSALFSGLSGSGELMQNASSDAERAGTAIGTGLGVTALLVLWMIGAVITGLLALLTRGGKTVMIRA